MVFDHFRCERWPKEQIEKWDEQDELKNHERERRTLGATYICQVRFGWVPQLSLYL